MKTHECVAPIAYCERFELNGIEILTSLLCAPSNTRRMPNNQPHSRIVFAFEILEMLLRDISGFKDFMCERELHGIRSMLMGTSCGLGFDCNILMNSTKSMWGMHAHTRR